MAPLENLQEEEGFCSGRGHMTSDLAQSSALFLGLSLDLVASSVPLTDQHEVDPGSGQSRGPSVGLKPGAAPREYAHLLFCGS